MLRNDASYPSGRKWRQKVNSVRKNIQCSVEAGSFFHKVHMVMSGLGGSRVLEFLVRLW